MARRHDPLTVREKVVSVPNKEKPMASTALSFNNTAIRSQDKFVSLTDMWKADGSDPSKRPPEWLRLASTVEFMECVSALPDVVDDIKNMRKSPTWGNPTSENVEKNHGLTVTLKGGVDRGCTLGHWHLAMAYAKYLSPAFHVWCNEVVRAHMQGQAQAKAPPDGRAMAAMAEQLERLTAEVIELRGHRMLPASLIGKGRAERLVLRRIRELGKMRSDMCGDDYKSLRGEIESSARFTINFFGAWGTLPEHRLADVDRYLMTVERDTLRQARRLHGFGRSGAKPGQLPLPLKLIKK